MPFDNVNQKLNTVNYNLNDLYLRNKYFFIFEHFPFPVVFFNRENKIEILNQKAIELFHKAAPNSWSIFPKAVGSPLAWLSREVASFNSSEKEYFKMEKQIKIENVSYFYEIIFKKIFSNIHYLLGTTVLFHDITMQKKAYEELMKADKLESLGILAAGIAHDFNNYLTVMLSSISLARVYEKKPEKVFEKIKKVEKAILQAKNLSKQLSLLSRGEEHAKDIVNLGELIEDISSFALSGSNVRCHNNLSPDLYPIEANSGQISQVLVNIIINAVHAMPNGGIIELIADNVYIQEDKNDIGLSEGSYVKISIKDEGVGIPNNIIHKIFEPFFTTKKEGSGLGLAIANYIVKKHSGVIKVYSQS
ncbi:MAG: hypothetical protein GX767_09200, partial [Firmicutes bacterium]|nr:hypothetical protein [Bacillota bacterium]